MHDENNYDRIIDPHELRAMVPFHPSHLARLEAIGEFPRRSVARGMVTLRDPDWVEQRKAERDAEPTWGN